MLPARALVVSLHDVHPRTFPSCQRIIAELQSLGVPHVSLLVVPDHHRRGHIASDGALCAWLVAREQAGHEIVLHGYHHQRERRAGESAWQRFITRFYTADEGEFYDLDAAAAWKLLDLGYFQLRGLGLRPRGFIAPAWLLGSAAEFVLRGTAMEYTTRLGSVVDVREQRTHFSQSLVWSVRSGWRRALSRWWNALLFQRLRARPLLRISIHPVDLDHGEIWRQICTLITRASSDREPMTYHAWIAKTRAALHPDSA